MNNAYSSFLSTWHSTATPPPNGLVVETKIEDALGTRNQQLLKRSGNL